MRAKINMCQACGSSGLTVITACGQELCSGCNEQHYCRRCDQPEPKTRTTRRRPS